MKLKNVFLLGALSLGLFACSDKDSSNKLEGEGEEAYFDLRLSFPKAASSSLKAGEPTTTDEDGDGYQPGLGTEQRFETVAVVIVGEDDKVTDYLIYTQNEFTPVGTSAGDDNTIIGTPDYVEYVANSAKAVTKGAAKVYVFLNPIGEIGAKFLVGKVISSPVIEMNSINSKDLTQSVAMDDNFFMSNAQPPQQITIDGTQANPTSVVVEVERLVTKLVENTGTAEFDIENSQGANEVTATLVGYDYNQLNKRSYLMRVEEVRNDAGAFAGSYVVDPNFIESDYKAFSPVTPWLGNDFFIIGNRDINRNFVTTPDIFYALENTMISNEQFVTKTTCVVYQASLTVDGTANTTLYSYKNILFTSYADLAEEYSRDYPDITNPLAAVFVESDVINAYESTGDTYSTAVRELNTTLDNAGIRCFYQGQCYYNWPIKYWDQPDTTLGRMEFGLVRNNVYYLEVTAILNVGTPWVPGGPEDPDPEIPDEKDEAYLELTIRVLPWTVRYNNIQF